MSNRSHSKQKRKSKKQKNCEKWPQKLKISNQTKIYGNNFALMKFYEPSIRFNIMKWLSRQEIREYSQCVWSILFLRTHTKWHCKGCKYQINMTAKTLDSGFIKFHPLYEKFRRNIPNSFFSSVSISRWFQFACLLRAKIIVPMPARYMNLECYS